MEQFGYRKSRLASWRSQGENPDDAVDLTEQCAVPALSDMLANVLAGRGTGLSSSTGYDEDDDFDISLTDKLDLEAQRQELSERVRVQRERKKTESDAAPQDDKKGEDTPPESSLDKPADNLPSPAE